MLCTSEDEVLVDLIQEGISIVLLYQVSHMLQITPREHLQHRLQTTFQQEALVAVFG